MLKELNLLGEMLLQTLNGVFMSKVLSKAHIFAVRSSKRQEKNSVGLLPELSKEK